MAYENYYDSNINLGYIEHLGYDLSTRMDLCDLIGREEEIKKIIKAIAIKGKSVLLLGEPGVGKTAIVEKLALDIKKGNSKFLRDKVIFSLDTTSLVAGCKYRGEFEAKFRDFINYCKRNKGNLIIFIDEIHTLCGLGAAEGAIDAINILKPHLSNGDITIIGATTKMEFEKYLAEDPAFLRRCEFVEVSPPTKEMNIEIMLSYIKELEAKYHIKYCVHEAQKLALVKRIFELTDGKCAYVTGNIKIENPTLAKRILENAFAEAIYNGKKKVTIEDMNLSIREHDQLSLEFISDFGYDLSKQQDLCNLVGREKELEKIIKTVAIAEKSVLLVGEPGTGKTSIVEKLALDIRNGNSEFLKGKTIFSLNTTSLESGTKYRGEFEEKMNKLINVCRKNRGKLILFIDEAHTLYGLGRTSDSATDAMNMLKPFMSNGDLTIILATTRKEYEEHMANDPAFLRRCEFVEISPLDEETKIQVLISYSQDLEKKYNVKVALEKDFIYQVMKYINKITELKYQTVKGDIKVENPTISKRLIESAFSDAIYHKKNEVTIEEICFAILECNKLPLDFRIECARNIREYINGKDIVNEARIPRLTRSATIGFTY